MRTKSEASEKTRKNFGLMKDDLSKDFVLLHNEEVNGMSMNITPSCVRTAKCSRPRLIMHVTRVNVKKECLHNFLSATYLKKCTSMSDKHKKR